MGLQNIDSDVTEKRQISLKYNVPIIEISSRDSLPLTPWPKFKYSTKYLTGQLTLIQTFTSLSNQPNSRRQVKISIQ